MISSRPGALVVWSRAHSSSDCGTAKSGFFCAAGPTHLSHGHFWPSPGTLVQQEQVQML